MESKKDIRDRVLAERNRMTKREWEEKSRRIARAVTAHPFFLEAEEIGCYMDFRNEVGTRGIIETAWKMGKRVAVPRIFGDSMEFYRIRGFQALSPGFCGILEPEADSPASGGCGLILMPGAAFDKSRNRIGYGKGYYDRYLHRHPNLKSLALAFELQVLENIPADDDDVRPQVIVTEETIYV